MSFVLQWTIGNDVEISLELDEYWKQGKNAEAKKGKWVKSNFLLTCEYSDDKTTNGNKTETKADDTKDVDL